MKKKSLYDLKFIDGNNSVLKEAKDLIDLACNSLDAFHILYNFFTTHANNSSSIADLEQELEFEREDFEEVYEKEVDEEVFQSLKDCLGEIHKPNYQKMEYFKVISLFQEFIVKEWRMQRNSNFSIYDEPKIQHKKKIIFKRKKYRNSKCDVVCIDRNEKKFEAYECKTTMKTFYKNLTNKIHTTGNKSKQSDRSKAKRKQDYLCGLIDLLSIKYDTNEVKVEYITYFNRHDFPEKIGKVPVFSLRNITFTDLFEGNY